MNEEEGKEDGARLFSAIPSDRTRGHAQKLKDRMFPLNTKKCFFTVRVTKHRHRFPRKVVESLFLVIFKSHLTMGNSGESALGDPDRRVAQAGLQNFLPVSMQDTCTPPG